MDLNCVICEITKKTFEVIKKVYDSQKEKEKENVVGFGQAEHQPASVNASDVTYDEYILSLIKKYKPFKNSSGMIAFQEVPMFSEMEQINSYLSMHPEAVNAA